MANADVDSVFYDVSLYDDATSNGNIDIKKGFKKDITKTHYIPKAERTTCKSCGTSFERTTCMCCCTSFEGTKCKSCCTSFVKPRLRKKYHCRRCGEIYCKQRLQYTQCLNIQAQWDKHGVICKVCLKCFEERERDLGVLYRSRTEEFMLERAQFKKECRKQSVDLTMEDNKSNSVPVLWREELNILKECLRLLDGFKDAVGLSGPLRIKQELTDLAKVPSWQKSALWKLEKASHVCRYCNGKLGSRKKIRNCRVCGLALCKKCSFKELLVFFRDGKKSQRDSVPRIAVIKYEGSPEVEPKYSVLLHVCKECKEYIAKEQVDNSDWFIQKSKTQDIMEQFVKLDETFHDLTNDITSDLEQLKLFKSSELDQTVSYHRTSGNKELVSTNQNFDIITQSIQEENIMTISKSMRQKLDKFFSMFAELKSLNQSHVNLHGCGSKLLTNSIEGKYLFYSESKSHLCKVLQDLDKTFGTI